MRIVPGKLPDNQPLQPAPANTQPNFSGSVNYDGGSQTQSPGYSNAQSQQSLMSPAGNGHVNAVPSDQQLLSNLGESGQQVTPSGGISSHAGIFIVIAVLIILAAAALLFYGWKSRNK